jgi:hypothetical protein
LTSVLAVAPNLIDESTNGAIESANDSGLHHHLILDCANAFEHKRKLAPNELLRDIIVWHVAWCLPRWK